MMGIIAGEGESQAPAIKAEIRQFLNRLLDDKGMGSVPTELREQMLTSLNERLEAWLLTTMAEKLSDDDAERLGDLMAKGDLTAEQAQFFFESHIANVHEVVAESMLEFAKVYLSA